MKSTLLAVFGLLSLFCVIVPVFAEDAIDPSIFIEPVSGGTFVHTSGWYGGWVVTAAYSGTYVLNITATGGESEHFPVDPVYIVVAISDESHDLPGLVSLKINSVSIGPFTSGPCPNLPPGGPFSEPDYYGFNDDYELPGDGITSPAGTTFTVEIVFSPSATTASKVAFLAYGFDAMGCEAKTPYTGQTMFQVPELATLALMVASLVAFGFYGIKRKRNCGS